MPKKPTAVPAPAADHALEPAPKFAAWKVRAELDAYREATCKLDGRTVYQKSPEILFTEAAADRLQFLAKDPDMAKLIMTGGTLKGCVESLVAYAKRDIGNGGEMPEEEFRAAIRDYYRMPEAAATKNDPKQMQKTTRNHSGKSDETVNQTETAAPKPEPKPAPKRKEPTMLTTQLDMFGMMPAPKSAEKEATT